MIRLSDFIAQTMTEIVSGVIAAQDNVKNTGARINPLMENDVISSGEFPIATVVDDEDHATFVKFNVSLHAEEASGEDAGVKIGVIAGFFGAGTEFNTESNLSSGSVHTISFLVPLALPVQRTR